MNNAKDGIISTRLNRGRFIALGAAATTLSIAGLTAANGSWGTSGTSPRGSGSGEITGNLSYFGWEGEDFGKEAANLLRQKGIVVQTEAMSADLDAIAKIRSGAGARIDIIGDGQNAAATYVEAGIVRPVDKSKIPNLKSIPADLLSAPGMTVNGQLYMVPTFWSACGLTRNEAAIPKPFTSWKDILDPSLKGKVGGATDSRVWTWPSAAALGYRQGQVPKADAEKFSAFVKSVIDQTRGLGQGYGDVTNQLVSGDITASYAGYTSYDVQVPAAGGKRTRTDIDLDGKRLLWADGIFITAHTQNADRIYAYLNALLDPVTQVAIAKSVAGGVVNPDAVPLLPPDLQKIYDYSNPRKFSDSEWALDFPTNSDQYITVSEWADTFSKLTS